MQFLRSKCQPYFDTLNAALALNNLPGCFFRLTARGLLESPACIPCRENPHYEENDCQKREPGYGGIGSKKSGQQQAEPDSHCLGESLHKHVDKSFRLVFFVPRAGDVKRLFGRLVYGVVEGVIGGVEKTA